MRASRRRSRALVALSVTAALMAAGCGSSGDSSSDTTAASSGGAATTAASGGAETTAAGGAATSAAAAAGGGAADLSALYDACKAEGQVNLIALPDDWANYKGILQWFRDKYGIENPVTNPSGRRNGHARPGCAPPRAVWAEQGHRRCPCSAEDR